VNVHNSLFLPRRLEIGRKYHFEMSQRCACFFLLSSSCHRPAFPTYIYREIKMHSWRDFPRLHLRCVQDYSSLPWQTISDQFCLCQYHWKILYTNSWITNAVGLMEIYIFHSLPIAQTWVERGFAMALTAYIQHCQCSIKNYLFSIHVFLEKGDYWISSIK
jgi:hypothetical protein